MTGKFAGRILVLGAGSVSQCSVPLLIENVVVNPNQITVLDFKDNKHRFTDPIVKGINFLIEKVTRENMSTRLAQLVSAGDVLLDLAWNIDANEIIGWCHENNV
ncbi:MAG: homospermidine synthase, partial [Actinobacteria bacterium]|nr:homospermidine synthase [Actinomycetota bacterium]